MVKNRYQHTHNRGVSIISVIIAAALVALVFGGLMSSFQLMLQVVAKSKLEAGGRALATERLEYIRSLAYDNVGTDGGIPSGTIPQIATTTLNGVVYQERVVVQYVDAADDGVGVADVNGILADYKSVKIEYSWNYKNATSSLALISNIVPRGIETTAGGGTLTVNVFDATVQPLSGAAVHLYNDTTTTTIDTTRYTNVNGVAMFAGAPAAANYEITVTDVGFSTDQTYAASTSNPNPITPHVAVLESEVSTMNFQIDALSDLTVETVGAAVTGVFTDPFDDLSAVATSSNVAVSSGALVLSGGAGAYAATGTAQSLTETPGVFDAWEVATFVASTTASTSVEVRVYTGTSTLTLVPDTDLPGNSSGFITGTIDISGLSTVTYPSLTLGVTLNTIDPNHTPELLEWYLSHVVNEPAIGSVPFTLTSNKTIGLSGTSSPVYKHQQSYSTDGSGDTNISGLEWDTYEVTLGTAAYDIARACDDIPYALLPGASQTLTLTLMPAVTHSMRVRVEDTSGNPIVGADVDISRSGFSDSGETGVCGQVFFNSGLTVAADYDIDVSATGYVSETATEVSVDGSSVTTIILSTP